MPPTDRMNIITMTVFSMGMVMYRVCCHLLGAVQHGGFVQGAVDAGDGGQIDHHAVAGALPDLEDNEEQGPVRGLGVPAVGLAAEENHHPVQGAVVGVEEGEYEVADHDPAQEVGEEHQGLVGLGGPLGVQLVDHDGQRNGDDDAQNDEDDIVKQGVAQQHGEGVVVNEEGKILEAHKFTVEQIVQEGLPGEDLVLLKGDNQAEHRQIAEQRVPDKRG